MGNEGKELAIREQGGALTPLEKLEQDMEAMKRVAKFMVEMEVGNAKTVKDAVVLMMVGRDFGMGSAEALTELYNVKGQVGTMTRTLANRFQARGHWFALEKWTAEEVSGKFCHARSRQPFTHTITRSEVDDMGWSMQSGGAKPNWKAMPKVMLYWTWLRTGIRATDPGVMVKADGAAIPTLDEIDANGEVAELMRQEAQTIEGSARVVEDSDNGGEVVDIETGEVVTGVPWWEPAANRNEFTVKARNLTLTNGQALEALAQDAGHAVTKLSDYPRSLEKALAALDGYVAREGKPPAKQEEIPW